MYSGTYNNRNNETYWEIQKEKKRGKVVEMKKASSVTMNVLTKTSTLFKSIYTNYQENWSLYNINNKKSVFYPSEICNQFSHIHLSITKILTVKIGVFSCTNKHTHAHTPTVLHGSSVPMKLIKFQILFKNTHFFLG